MIKTGLTYMDKILGGGFPENTVILLSGGPGTGKTLFGMNFLMEGAKEKKKCCYVSMMENKEELLRACDGIESLKKLKKYSGKNFVIQEIKLSEKPSENAFDPESFIKLFNKYPKMERIVLDNVNKLLLYAKDEREYRRQFSQLVKELKKRFKCSLIICETQNGIDSGNSESFECDGVVNVSFLDLEEKPKRTMEVHKLRYTKFEPKVPHEFKITSKGLKLSKSTLI